MESQELIEKYNIDVEKLEKEQLELAKRLEIKDKIDFSLADRFGAIDISFVGNKILASAIICGRLFKKDGDKRDCEIIDRAYFIDKVRFPYLTGFRAYRELPAMIEVFNKLNEKPDVVFISGQGITHPRLGLASHFSLSTGISAIGVANSVADNVKVAEAPTGVPFAEGNILKDGKKVGKVFTSKLGSRPMYISPGDGISVDSSLKLCQDFINLPHKLPEPIHLANKYGREIKKELN